MRNYQKFLQKCKFYKKIMKYRVSEDEWQFFQGVKNGKSSTFQNFFFNFEIGHKKMSKMDFKKKVCKNENHFFFDFFFRHFFCSFLC